MKETKNARQAAGLMQNRTGRLHLGLFRGGGRNKLLIDLILAASDSQEVLTVLKKYQIPVSKSKYC